MEASNAVDELEVAVIEGNVEIVRRVLRQDPSLLEYEGGCGTWLHRAAHHGHPAIVKLFIELGCNINAICNGRSVLENAVAFDHVSSAKLLLEHGADPNHDRIVISAIVGDNKHSLELVKLLEQYGADLHRVFVNEFTGQPMNALSTAIDWGKQDVAEYLRSRGCVLPEESEQPVEATMVNEEEIIEATAVGELCDQVVAYFAEHFGPVQPQSLIEIVPTEPPIAIHVVPARADRNHVTLFTTGMSEQAMTIPPGGDPAYRFAELFIQLPGNWSLDRESLADPRYGWPIHWLRMIAKFPHQHQTWLGGPVAIFAKEDPPEPLAPGVRFTSMLLLAERSLDMSDRRKIQLYRLTPLYPEERELEMSEGIAALMRAFDRHSTPFIVDLGRPNVAAGGHG